MLSAVIYSKIRYRLRTDFQLCSSNNDLIFILSHLQIPDLLIYCVESVRVHKIDTNAVVPEEYLEVGLKQESSVLNKLTPETKSIPKSSVPKQEVVVSRSEESESKECKTKSVLKSRPDGAYKPPLVPDEETFQARISCIGDDGTIYIIPKSLGKILYVWKIKYPCGILVITGIAVQYENECQKAGPGRAWPHATRHLG